MRSLRMKNVLYVTMIVLIPIFCLGCVFLKKTGVQDKTVIPASGQIWNVDAPCFIKSCIPDAFDEIAVKDPTIVYWNGNYHMFYTGVTNTGSWQMGYASAATIPELKNTPHIFMSNLREGYFCAPQVFYFEPHSKWYLIYQDGRYGAAYATSTDIADPGSWKGPYLLEFPGGGGYDYFVICDDAYAYLFNTPQDNSRSIVVRKTLLENFPAGWDKPFVAVTDTFEGVCVYKCLSDNKYYLLVEDLKDNRYYELHMAVNPAGPWEKVAEKWISRHNLSFNSDKWTDNVSHGEIIRTGVNQKMEISDINRVDFLFQGVLGLNHGQYWQIPWDIGVMHNYTK
jgi:hypothetical protein